MTFHLTRSKSFASLRLIVLLALLPVSFVFAQKDKLYNFQDLSGTFYAKQKDSLKKNWVCPVIYKDKETQKYYNDLWDKRTAITTKAIDDNDFVNDGEVYTYLNNIMHDIAVNNKQLVPVKPLLFLDRSSSVNAYNIGGNVIAVNAGLVVFARDREDIALALAHELAHDILGHADKSMRERAEWFTSAEYKASVNAVLDSKYERLTRLKKVFEGFTFSRNKHNRYHESDADSLAIVLLKNSHIGINPEFF